MNFVSIEPLQERIFFNNHNQACFDMYKWVIVGAETGNRKDKIIPKAEWIEEIREYCQSNSIPYFEKGSISNIVNRKLVQEFPK